MAKKQQIRTSLNPISELERFTLVFEYDKTLQEVRRDVRMRTHKHAL